MISSRRASTARHVELAGHRLAHARDAPDLGQQLARAQQRLRGHAGVEGALAADQLAARRSPPRDRRRPARPAHTSPAGPAPTTTTSNSRSATRDDPSPGPVRKVGSVTVYFARGPALACAAWPPPTPFSSPTTRLGRKHFIFTEEHDQLRESIRAFVAKELAPHADEWEETTFPDSVFRRMGELGFLGLSYPGGVRRPGRRLLLQPRARRGDGGRQLRRAGDGRGGAHRHGHAAGPPVRHRGAEAGLPRARDQGREDLLPRDHRARRRLRRGRHQDARRARRRRVGDQRLEDLHHQRPPRRLHRARHQDRPGRGLRRLHAVPGRHGPAGRDPREEAREARHARVRHGAAGLPGRARARGRRARPGGQGLLPHHVGAPGRAADRRGGLRRGRPAVLRPHARSTPTSATPSAARSASSR